MTHADLIPRLAAAVLVVLCCSRASADGKVFPRADAQNVVTPDQSALVAFADGVETLAIETKAVGGGSELGWIVPVPGEPEISSATPGLFPTLRAITAPHIVASGSASVAAWALFIGSLLLAIGLLGRWTFWLRIALAVIGVLLVLVLLPSLGSPRGLAAGSSQLEAHTRYVGAYEVSTLHGSEGSVVADWLKGHGYTVPADAGPVVDDYAAHGWYFVASRLRRDAAALDAASLHPLMVRFKTPAPVYPMRLTGVDQPSALSLDLFVYGPSRAAVDGLDVRWCRRVAPMVTPEFSVVSRFPRPRIGADGETVEVSHACLRSAMGGPGVLTRLVGSVSPGAMRSDLSVRWEEYSPKVWRGLSAQGAREYAALASAGVLLLSLLGVTLMRARVKRPPAALLGCLIAALVAGLGVRIVAPVMPTLEGRRALYAPTDLASIGESWGATHEHWPPRRSEEIIAEFRAEIAQRGIHSDDAREGDAPGCWMLRDGVDGAELIVYDLVGNEYPIPLFWEH